MNRMRAAVTWLMQQRGRARDPEAIGQVLEYRLRAAAARYHVILNIRTSESRPPLPLRV